MESQSFFVNLHGLKARDQPTLLKAVVQVRCAVSGLKQQSILATIHGLSSLSSSLRLLFGDDARFTVQLKD
jgi:hypothetical protein